MGGEWVGWVLIVSFRFNLGDSGLRVWAVFGLMRGIIFDFEKEMLL